MHPFSLYLQLGFDHISDLAGFDHILFLVTLCAVYRIAQWKSILILVTAFTVGHSVTLALTSFSSVAIPSSLIEFLIPTTILLTAIYNVVSQPSTAPSSGMTKNYAMALVFGFIHGMGFSNYFRALLMDDSSIAVPLFSFNLGIEIGQILVVAVIVGVAFVFHRFVGVKHRDWNLFVSGAAAGMAVLLMAENKFW